MASEPSQHRVDRFYRSLSRAAQLRLWAAIFLLFAPVGLLVSSRFVEVRPAWLVLAYLAASGLTAVGWALAATYDWRLLLVVIPASLGAFLALQGFGPAESSLLGLLLVVLIGLGFVFFIVFVNQEGARTVQLRTEMALARDIHRTLVPPIDRSALGYEICGRSWPSAEVGGDLVDVVERGDRCVLFVADVVGHGVPAGVVMAMVRSAMRMRLRDEDGSDMLFDDLDRMVAELGMPGLFVTCAGLELSPGRVAYASAGHLPVLHYAAARGALEPLTAGGRPLGIGSGGAAGGAARYAWHPVATSPNDLLVLVTDGLTEVFDRRGQDLGLAPLEEVIREHARLPVAEIADRLVSAARRHGPQLDDQTVLIARRLS